MEIARFRKILMFNQENRAELLSEYNGLFSRWGCDPEREMLEILQMARMFAGEKTLIAEMPFGDDEIGALYYRSDAKGYLLLNSSLPRVNVNYALCHEIYHIFCQKQPLQSGVELYLNEHYYEHRDECMANAVAGMLLMPERSFRQMFLKFYAEDDGKNNPMEIVARLMNYYQAPYMAVLIRCYELGLFRSDKGIKEMLEVDTEQLHQTFSKLWLNEDILEPSLRDDYAKLKALVEREGKTSIEHGVTKERELRMVLNNMQKIYEKMRGK